MRKQVEAVLKQHITGQGQPLLLALSGGRDSVALGHLLCGLQQELGFSLIAAHFNHGIRGRRADRDQRFVESLCRRWGVPCYTVKEDIPALGGNLEQTARTRRYAWLRQQKQRLGAEWIVTAHHGGDQAETLLLHLLRGAGLEGLAAMATAEQDVLRPLLAVQTEEIAAYCRREGLCWRHDASNDDPSYRRNRIRLELLPQLEQYNPQIRRALCQTAAICQQDQTYWRQATAQAAAVWSQQTATGLLLAAESARLLPTALWFRLLRWAYQRITGGSTALTYELCCQIAQLGPGKELALTGGVYCSRLPEGWLFSLARPAAPPAATAAWGPVRQPLPGQVLLPEAGLRAVATLVQPPLPALEAGMLLLPAAWQDLYWRSRRPGDRMLLPGRAGRQKVKDLLINEKIPVAQRDTVPLLCRQDQVLWAPGLRRSAALQPVEDKAWLIQLFSL